MDQQLAPEVSESLVGRWKPIYRSKLHYLVTWSTRGRRPVLKERHMRALHELIQRTFEERGESVLEIASGPDHVHVLMALKPSRSVSSVVRELKGRTAMTLLAEFPELRVWLRGNLAWDERYAVETVSAARVEWIRTRLRSLHGGAEGLARAS